MTTDEELLAEIAELEAQIRQLCAGQDECAIPTDSRRGTHLTELQQALAEAKRCVCQDKLAKWQARRNG